MAKHEYYVVQGKTLDNVAETMKTVLGVDKDTPIRFDEITNDEKVEQVTESVDVQAEVIEQIKAALNGKSSIGVKEIMDIIDQSGVLDSTEGTATEKVEQLIDKAEDENNLYEASKLWTTQFAGLLNTNTNVKKCPRFSFEKATSLRWFAPYSTIETIDYYINSPNITTIEQGFRDCKNLYFMYGVDLSNTVNAKELFYNCENLETIQEPLDFSKITLNTNIFMFYHCYKLKNIKFVENSIKKTIQNGFVDSPLLTAESIQSIIDGLATVETAQTLALHADVKAKLTTEQLATITNKNWNLA